MATGSGVSPRNLAGTDYWERSSEGRRFMFGRGVVFLSRQRGMPLPAPVAPQLIGSRIVSLLVNAFALQRACTYAVETGSGFLKAFMVSGGCPGTLAPSPKWACVGLRR